MEIGGPISTWSGKGSRQVKDLVVPPNEFNQVTKVSLDLGRGVAFEYIVCSNMHNDRVTLWILKHEVRKYVLMTLC